jgi:phenylacetate-CoA ligase
VFRQQEEESADRHVIEKIQLERLQETVRRVYKHVPFYRRKFDDADISPGEIKNLSDIRRIPFTFSDDIQANYPYGLLAVPRDELVRLHTSSGTTGKPKPVFFSKRDIDQGAELIARCLVMTGMQKGDVLQNMMTYGLFTGALVMHYGAEKIGVLVIPSGPGNIGRQILLMRDFRTTAIHITPSYILYLADALEKKGIDPRSDLSLKRAFIGAEPYSEETRKKIEDVFGIDVYNSYGLTEMNGPGVAFECAVKQGMHIWEDNFLVEIVDPGTGDALPEGRFGELVLTTLSREAMPILRYRTRDITSVIPGRCACGRTHRRISRVVGRSDDMFIMRGVNIFPQQIERVLMGVDGVARNYQIILESLDEMTVQVEIVREIFDGNVDRLLQLKKDVADKLRSEILISPKVELLEPGVLPVFEGKAKRVIDKRTL